MADRAKFQDCRQQLKERIAERGAALLSGLERIPQVQAEGRLGLHRNFGVPHPPPHDSPFSYLAIVTGSEPEARLRMP
jgi:hypothetical protein